MTFLLRLCVVLLPWPLRRHVLRLVYGYELHPTARIGWSWIFPRRLVMGERARIGHLNVAIHLERIELGAQATIDRGNWITGFPQGDPRHFAHRTDRDPTLVLGAHSAITKHHHLDCTDRIAIGAFTTVAGYASQLLTHSIDLAHNRQDAAPIAIGDYCFVGTAVVILGGAKLPARSVLGAKALLNHSHELEGQLYAGVPAKAVQPVAADAGYFRRSTGFVT
jgi:acetyltransferase-like isoleucine patch superfamily enzyme